MVIGDANVATSVTTLFSGLEGLRVQAPQSNGWALKGEGGALGVWGRTDQSGTGIKAGVYGGVFSKANPGPV